MTTTPRQHQILLLALQHVVRNVLQVPDAVSVRVGRGISRLPPDKSALATTIWWWERDFDASNVSELDGCPSISTSSLVGDDWTRMKYLQVLHADAAEGQMANALEPAGEDNPPDDPSASDRLSTIEEGSAETEASSISNLLAEFNAQHPPAGCDEAW